MTDYCGGCDQKKAVKPCCIDGEYEDYFCAKCRKELAAAVSVQVLRIDYSDL